MSKIIKYFIAIVANTVIGLVLALKVFAVKTGVPVEGKTSFTDYNDYIKAVFDFAVEAGVALTTLMLIYAGYKYMTSRGDQSAISEAKDIIIGSLSGFAMLLLIYLIINVLSIQ